MTAQLVAQLYRQRVFDQTISCTIRIAHTDDTGERSYWTVGRSDGLDPNRPTRTQPIPAEKGIPAKLRSADLTGAFIIPSIADAIESGDYYRTPNDDLPDCRSVIVAPINGWVEGEKVMVGMIAVASRRPDNFASHLALPLMAIADVLGLVYPIMIARLTENRRLPSAPHFDREPRG